MAKKRATPVSQSSEEANIKSFLDMIAPSVVSFMPDHFICGNTYRCVWALREYPTSTDEQAILRHLGEKDGITLRIYTRQVTPAEEKRIIQNAANKNRMNSSNTNDLQQTVTAESNLQDVATLVAAMHRNREPLLHCAVYIELTASDYNTLKLLQTDVLTELVRSKLNVDKLLLRQQQGFRCVNPSALWAAICWAGSSSGYSPPAAWPISIPSTTPASWTPRASTSAKTNTAATSWWTSTSGMRTKPLPTS